MAFQPIQIIINAKDNASAVFSSLQARVAAVGAAIASYFGFQAFVGVIKGASDLEAAMSRVQAATGASTAEMQALKAVVQDAGANTKFSAVEAAGALEELGKAGVSASDSIKVLPAVIKLAEASGTSLGRATEVTTSIVMGLGLQFTEAARVADVLAQGANATKTSVEGLGQALSYAAPVAKSLGLSLEATTAIIGQFAQSGIDASRAGTALNSILSQFADPASRFREQLNLIGITTNDFEKALHQLAAAGPEGAAAINSVGLEAGPALRALIGQGMGALDELKTKLLDAAGSAEATAKIMRDNLAGSMQKLANMWDTVTNVLGTPVLPVLKDGVDQLTSALRRAVADGSVAKLGEALAAAFKNGIQWLRDFLAQIDFQEAIAKAQAFAAGAAQSFASVASSATAAGNAVKVAYGVMSAGVNAVAMGIYGLAASYAEAAIRIVEFSAKASEALSKIAFGDAKAKLIQQAQEMRESLAGLAGVRDEFLKRMNGALLATADAAEVARNGASGFANALADTGPAATQASAAIAAMRGELEKMGQASASAAEKQANAAKTAADAVVRQAETVRALRAELEQAISLRDWQAAAEVQQKLDAALRSTAQAAAQSSAQIEQSARAQAARNSVIEAALGLEHAKEQAYEAEMRAIGNLNAATQSQIRQKEIEIKVIEAKVKAMNDEADAEIRAAEAKMRELKGNDELVAAKRAELQNAIELAKAKKLEADAIDATTAKLRAEITAIRNGTSEQDRHAQSIRNVATARDAATAALERENAERERMVAAQEKANQLLEREDALRRKKWNVDKEGFTLDANGQRQQQSLPTGNYVYDAAKSQGLEEKIALELMDRFFRDGKGVGTESGSDWFSTVNKAIAERVIDEARKRVQGGGATQGAGGAGGGATATAADPVPTPGPAGGIRGTSGGAGLSSNGITHVVNVSIGSGAPRAIPTNDVGSDGLQGLADDVLRVIESARWKAGR